MRILTVGPTGVVAMQRVLRWMADRHEQVWVVDHTAQFRSQVPAGFGFSPLLLPKGGARAQRALRRAGLGGLAKQVTTARLQRIAAGFQPEIVHAHNVTDLGMACVDAGLGPLVVSTWGALSQLVAEPGRPLSEAVRRQVAEADAVVVDAPSLLDPVRSLAKPGAAVEHIPMGADTQRFRPGRTAAAIEWRAFFGIPAQAFVLLSPRSWAEFYGHQVILHAYVEAFPHLDRPAVLAFAGLGDGPQALPHMAQAWATVSHAEAARTVRWLPKIRYDEMHTLFAMADAVVNFPAQDSFPATLVEAAACEVPILTAVLPTYRGTFVETAALLVEPGDVAALAQGIVELVNRPAPVGRLAAARLIVVRDYDDRVIQEKLWGVYASLV